MWIKIILSLLVASTIAQASLPELFFENVNGVYTDGKGSAHVMDAKYKIDNVLLMHKDIEVNFNKKEKNLVLLGPSTVVHFGFDFSFLNIFRIFDFKGVDVKLKEKDFTIKAKTLFTQIGKFDYNIDNLSLKAQIQDMDDPDNLDQILDSFITKGSVEVDKVLYTPVSINDFKKELHLDKINLETLKFTNKMIKAKLRWLKLDVTQGQIRGSVLVDSWINAWLRFSGKIVNMKKSKVLRIELTRAKLGYFGVKRFVLKALRKLESDNISVDGNVINISIN